jgi:type VI protein secretion system component Hcp
MILLCLCKEAGGGILGDSEISKHKNWIACQSVEVEIAREAQDAGDAKKRTHDLFTTIPEVWEITITRMVDRATMDVMKYAASGEKVVDVGKIHYLISGSQAGDKASDAARWILFMELILDSPVISKWELSGDADSRPTETIAIRYDKISLKYWSYDGKQRVGYGPRGWARKELKEWTGSHES